jgi:hypothetical protein
MSSSQAYKDFLASLELAESLLTIESGFPDPAPDPQRKAAEGLRGGASVLMVAAFENYLKELVEEYLDDLTHVPVKFKVDDVPKEMLFSNLDYLVKVNAKKKSAVKVQAYNDMAKIIVAGVMYPASFTDAVRSNPNSEKLQELFKRLGVKKFFETIKANFDTLWGAPTANTFISDYLDGILQRRHTVAHTANALNISRIDLQDSLRFLKILGAVCDTYIAQHIHNILHPPSSSTP